ncbi:unnamed protein product [Closterium sp. NIES-54]
MAPGQQALAVDMAVEGAEDDEEEGLEAKTSTEVVGVADTAMTTRTTDAVADGSTTSVVIVTIGLNVPKTKIRVHRRIYA